MSFSGPTAPITSRTQLHRQIRADLSRLFLAALGALAVTALGVAGMSVSTSPRWLSLLVQPFAFLLFPGFLVEALDHNTYAFSTNSILGLSVAFYFCLALLCLFPSRTK